MSAELSGLCRDHSFESAAAVCRRCGLEYCEACVVHPFGKKKPYCKECAMALAGVRASVTKPAMGPRLIKKRVKAFSAMAKNRATAPMPEPVVPLIVDPTLDARPAQEAAVSAEPPDFDELASEHIPIPAEPAPTGDGIAPTVDWNNPFD